MSKGFLSLWCCTSCFSLCSHCVMAFCLSCCYIVPPSSLSHSCCSSTFLKFLPSSVHLLIILIFISGENVYLNYFVITYTTLDGCLVFTCTILVHILCCISSIGIVYPHNEICFSFHSHNTVRFVSVFHLCRFFSCSVYYTLDTLSPSLLVVI